MAKNKVMGSRELVKTISEETGVPKHQVQVVLDGLSNLAYRHAKNGFKIPGLGKLVLVDRQARTARNPKTGELVQVPAKKALKFRIAKAYKDAVLS